MKDSSASSMAERFFEEYNKRIGEQNKLISNYDYINWLENFTLSNPCFTVDSWLYHPEEISQEDNNNVLKLFVFHEVISEYCQKFLINISVNDNFDVTRIHIKYNNIGYQFGLVIGQGSYVYIEREEINEKAIDFSDIVNNVEPEDFEEKKEMLKTLEFLVSTMKQKEVPISRINSILKKHYN